MIFLDRFLKNSRILSANVWNESADGAGNETAKPRM